MSWGRGVHNEKLKRSQRLALGGDGIEGSEVALGGTPGVFNGGVKATLSVLQLFDDISLAGVDKSGRQYGYCSLKDMESEAWGLSESCRKGDVFCYVRTYAQVLQKLRVHPDVPSGHIVFAEVQRQNLEVTRQDKFEFTVIALPTNSSDSADGNEIYELQDVCMYARPRKSAIEELVEGKTEEVVVAAAKELTRTAVACLFGLIASTNERYLVEHDGVEWVLTVSEVGVSADVWEDDLVIPDIKYGRVTGDTRIYLSAENDQSNHYKLVEPIKRPPGKSFSDIVNIICSDEEMFPVRKKLLTPCIKLTSVVASGLGKYKTRGVKSTGDQSASDAGAAAEGPIETNIDVDCLTFDRCLLYLESECRGRGEDHDFEAVYNEDMLDAAKKLGCRGLEDLCLKKMRAFESRVRKEYIRWKEVLKRNEDNNETILVMDGMVYDVTRWLPEHPGGNTIIPKQALGKDSTKFFELYHSSRKSFMYLKEFYIGEIHPNDLKDIPPASKGAPSIGFLEQLREFTTWRIKEKLEEKGHKSF